MSDTSLQKNADTHRSDLLPKEILNPMKTAEQYILKMYKPSPSLAKFVDHYWVMRWDRRGELPFTAEVIPSPYTNLTFMPEGARITGITTGKYVYVLEGSGVIVGAKFRPGGLYPFLTTSLHELTDTIIPASHVFSGIDEAYNDEMIALSDKEAIENLAILLQEAHPQTDDKLELIAAIIDFLEVTECPTVAAVAAHFGMSQRRLQEIFRERVGVGIKWIVLRARLIKAAELAAKLDAPNWTEIAYDLGYADQSHLVNDFKRIVGVAPAQYAAEIHANK